VQRAMKPVKTSNGAPARVRRVLAGNKKQSGRPKRTRNRAGKKHALMLAALSLFASKGYESTTTREIAAAAGCAEGLIHRYFRGKAGLLDALVEHRSQKEASEGAEGLGPTLSLEDEFLQLVDHEVERMWDNRDFLRVFLSRAIVDPQMGSVMNKALISSRTKAVLNRLQNHGSRGSLRPDAAEILAHSAGMLGLVFGFVRPVILGQSRSQARKMAASVARILATRPGQFVTA